MYKPVIVLTFVALLGTSMIGQAPPPALARVPAPPQVQPDPQMPPIVFRSEVNYVEVDAVVRDDRGQFVRDLGREDFEILENGKPQNVTTFSLVEIPVTRYDRPLFSPATVEPDVGTNIGGPEGRVYVLVLDDIHTSPMRSAQVQQAARQFVERNIGANDIAAVVHTGGRQEAGQEFTSNPRLLTEAVGKFMGKKLRSATLERIDQFYQRRDMNMSTDALKDPLEFERAYNARSVLETIGNISRLLAGVSGRRKAVVFFSEGIDYDIWNFMENRDATSILEQTRDAIAEATRANVNVYSIDPRGLTTFGEDGIEMLVPGDADPSLKLGMQGLMDEGRLGQDSLRVLAEETGGFSALNTNDFSTAFQRIVDENSTYYVMGYYPSNDRRDGSFRKIEVRVKRPGLTVRSRKGYVAPRGKAPAVKGVQAKEGTSAVLADALNSPVQVRGLPVSVFAAAFRGPAPNAAVALVTQLAPMQGIAFGEKDGKRTNTLEVSVIAVDPQGKVRGGTRETVDLSLRPETYQRVVQLGFRVQSRFELPPGRYQLRVAAREAGGKVGSVHYDLLVPDFAKEPLSISGLALTSAMATAVPTAGTVEEIKGMPAPPTAARVFSARDQLGLLVEIYDNQPVQSHSVEIVATLRGDDGRVVFSTSEKRASAELGGKAGGYGYTTTVPLKDVAPGLYVLKVAATSTLAGGSASREVLIRVVP